MPQSSPLQVAPPFELPTPLGDIRTLDSFLKRGRLLLMFHRGTWCPTCRRRLAELAQEVEEFRRHHVETAVVLPQRASGVQRYTGDRKLPFDILVDETREVVKAYGVWHRIGLDAWNISRPAVFLIEKDRSISYSFIGQSQREFPSLEEVLRAI